MNGWVVGYDTPLTMTTSPSKKAQCHNCGKTGHLARDCWTPHRVQSVSDNAVQPPRSAPACHCSLPHGSNQCANGFQRHVCDHSRGVDANECSEAVPCVQMQSKSKAVVCADVVKVRSSPVCADAIKVQSSPVCRCSQSPKQSHVC